MKKKNKTDNVPKTHVNTMIPKINKNVGYQIPGLLDYAMLPKNAVTYQPNYEIPIQQVYNINLPSPANGGHATTNKIYEAILPGNTAKLSYSTLGERLEKNDYIRQVMINVPDGGEIGIDDDRNYSIMSYMKFLELNPNYYSPIYANPYRGLPFGL